MRSDSLLREPTRPRSLALLGLLLAAMAVPGTAQMQKKNIIGDTPEPGTNNWLYPLGPTANPFHRPNDVNFPQTVARVQLGKLVFWDEQLSSDNTMACGTCHIPSAGGTDIRDGASQVPGGNIGAIGVVPQDLNDNYGDGTTTNFDRLVTGVAAPPMIASGFFSMVFWDLRAGPDFKDANGIPIPGFDDFAALEDQAAGPPISDIEMAHAGIMWQTNEIQDKLAASMPLALATPSTIPPDVAPLVNMGLTYDQHFTNAFGAGGVTRERISMAIAHYERTLVPNQAPLDIPNGMTVRQRQGFDIMNGSNCFTCHGASTTGGNPQLTLTATNNIADPFDQLLSDGRTHDVGLPPPGDVNPDVKTPTLRNMGLRPRFFHSGQFSTLQEIVDFYNGDIGNPNFPFNHNLSQAEKLAVMDFLGRALTDPRVVQELPPFDRPDLYSERVPFEANEYGTGTAGTGGLVPDIIANAPPKIGNMRFKVGVGDGLPNALAGLGISTTPANGPSIWIGPGTTTITNLNGQGIGTVKRPVPNAVSLIGVNLFMQWTIADPAAPFGRARSDAAQFVIF